VAFSAGGDGGSSGAQLFSGPGANSGDHRDDDHGSADIDTAAARIVPQWPNAIGFCKGQNVKIEYRSAKGQFDRIPASGGKARHVLPGFSRERPTSTHAAWSCEPVTRIIVMEKLCAHW
jgi:hypothetical protein